MKPAEPFDPDHPYAVSEDGCRNLHVVKHTLKVFADLAGDAADSHVTLSRESLSVFTGHLCEILNGV